MCSAYSHTATEAHSYTNGTCVCGATQQPTTVTVALTATPTSNTAAPDEAYDSRYGSYYRTFSITGVSVNGSPLASPYTVNYAWTLDRRATNVTGSYCTLYAADLSSGTHELSCIVTVYNGSTTVGSATKTWTISSTTSNSQINVSATVYDTNPGYALGDIPDEGNSSIIDQIENQISRNNSRDYLEYITFYDIKNTNGELSASRNYSYYVDGYGGNGRYEEDLSEVVFYPTANLTNANSTATASFQFTAYTRYSTTGYSGTMTFTIKRGESVSTGDLILAGESGKDLELSAADFENWWTDMYPSGSLSYVEFTSLTSGKLYADYNGSKGTSVIGTAGYTATACYVEPSKRQTALDGLTFVPASNKATQVTLRFTAYGSTSRGGSASRSRSGTATILMMNSVVDIPYTAVNGTVNLNATDFTDAYRKAVGSNSSNLTFQFRNVPASGTLSYKNGTRTVTLTSSNVNSQSFTTKNIGDVTYTAGKSAGTETVEFLCYSGGTFRFMGTITFTARPSVVQNLTKTLNCTSASGVPIRAMDVWELDTSIQMSTFVTLGTPTSGALYVRDTMLSSNTRLSFVTNNSALLFSDIVYKPADGATTGTVTIPFAAYDANGSQTASGTLQIVLNVPAPVIPDPTPEPPTNPTNPTTPTTPARPPVPTNPSKTFGDVANDAAGSWYYNEVLTLADAGIIGGVGNGSFEPKRDVTYGEALKMILMAAGYDVKQGTGENWANPIVVDAAGWGVLPNQVINTNDTVSRNIVASIAAKALANQKLIPAVSASATSDDYFQALSNAGVMVGNSAGFEGEKNLNRAEMAVMVWRMYNLRDKAQ